MGTVGRDLESVLVTERDLWQEGPPHELFRELRHECPIHWTESFEEFPDEPGFWSVTTADDIHTVSRDWHTYSSERGGVLAAAAGFPLELARAMFIGMDPPKHDRLKALFQAGFTPKRIAAHEDAIRAIVVDVLDRLAGRETCDLVSDVAQPVVSRVIGSFMGIPEEDDAVWANLMNSTLGAGDPDLNPDGIEGAVEKDVPEIFERCRRLIAERQENPTDDLTSVLVNAEVDGQKLEEHEIVMGFFLLVAAGNDSTKATYCSGMRALMENPEQMRLLLDDPSLIPAPSRSRCGCSPPSPTSAAPRPATPSCTARRSARARRWSCGTSPRTATRRATRTPTASTCGETQSTKPSVPADGTSASGRRSPASSCRSCSRRRSSATRRWRWRALRPFVESLFINQLKTLPVRL